MTNRNWSLEMGWEIFAKSTSERAVNPSNIGEARDPSSCEPDGHSRCHPRLDCMKSRKSSQTPQSNLPVSKQTAGGVAGAVIGSAVGGPVGAVVGGIAGTMMGNRAAKGKSLVSSATVKTGKDAVAAVRRKVPSLKAGLSSLTSKSTKTKKQSPKARTTASPSRSEKRKPAKTTGKRK